MKSLKKGTKRFLSFALALLMVVSTIFVADVQEAKAEPEAGTTYEVYYDAETQQLVGFPEVGTTLKQTDIIKGVGELETTIASSSKGFVKNEEIDSESAVIYSGIIVTKPDGTTSCEDSCIINAEDSYQFELVYELADGYYFSADAEDDIVYSDSVIASAGYWDYDSNVWHTNVSLIFEFTGAELVEKIEAAKNPVTPPAEEEEDNKIVLSNGAQAGPQYTNVKELGDKKVGTFLEIDLTKRIGDYETKVSETTGAVEILDATYDEATGTITFETDKFSTYAVVYEDVAVKAPAATPEKGASTN